MTCRILVTATLTVALFSITLLSASAASVDATLLREIQADLAQKAGLGGSGIVVGVISAGINGYQDAQAIGALPTNIEIIGDYLGTGGEGAAMLEIVHQIAPKATLAFCSDLINTTIPVSYCAQQLVQTFGAQVVVDDLGNTTRYTYAPFPDSFNYDRLLVQYPSLVAIHSGGNQEKQSFAGQFIPTPLNIGGITYQVEDFGKAAGLSSKPYESVVVAPGELAKLLLQSNQNPNSPPPSSNDVLAVWVLDQSGNVLYTLNWNKYSLPIYYQNSSTVPTTVKIIVGLLTQSNPSPLAMTLSSQSGDTLPINGEGGAGELLGPSAGIWSIAAVNEQRLMVEPLSDTGPTMVYFSATQIGIQNGAPVLSYSRLPQPMIIDHPELAGVDCVSISPINDFNNDGNEFCGTSAAAPTVAGVVALMLSAGYNKYQILQSLELTAKPIPTAGLISTVQSSDTWDPNDGYGLVQTWTALRNAGLLIPEPSITSPLGFTATISAGQSVSFAGTCVPPTSQTVKGYSWTFEGANAPVATTQQNPTITFLAPGNYTANFTCTDSQGIANPYPATASITVNETSSNGLPLPASGGGGSESVSALVLLASLVFYFSVQRRKAFY